MKSPVDMAGADASPGGISWRSALLGLILSAGVCALTPFNDYVVANTFLIGGYLPLAVVLTIFALVIGVNVPLRRFCPALALRGEELAVIVAMMLVACALPTQGLMRYFLPMLVGPFHHGASNSNFYNIFLVLKLPAWLFPAELNDGGRSSSVVMDFYNRVQPGQPMPWRAWMVPLVGWGIFLFAMLATLMAMAVLVYRQWAVNERLSFPLAKVQLALIENPQKGKLLNDLLRRKLFWWSLLAVVGVQSFVALRAYWPKYVPEIPMRYNLARIMGDEPWSHFSWYVKTGTIYFTFIGIAYFIPSRIGFSLWGAFLLEQLVVVRVRAVQSDIPDAAWRDQHLGAAMVLAGGVLWIGRKHWGQVLMALRGRCADRALRREAWALAVALVGCAVMWLWLHYVGVSWFMAVGIIGFILLAHLVTARVVAETGLPFIRTDILISQVYGNFSAHWFSGADIFFAGVFTGAGPVTTRESLMGFTLHSLSLTDQSGVWPRKRLLGLLAITVVVAFFVSAGSSLWCYYHYATPITDKIQTVLNSYALETRPQIDLVDPLTRWAGGAFVPKTHSPLFHGLLGAGIMLFLQGAAWRWAAWPLMPVGYLLGWTWYVQTAWFSLFIGWMAKVLIVRFGSSRMYLQARPLFVGLIIGEALAAGIWLLITLLLAGLGVAYQPIEFLPH